MPFLADTDFPWVVVAMVFIAFIRWVLDRIQEATRGPQEVVFEDSADEEEEEDEELADRPSPASQAPGPPPLTRPPSPPVTVSDPLEEFRRLLESTRSSPPPAESRRPLPPPIPVQPPAPPATVPSQVPARAGLPVLFPTTHSAPVRQHALTLTPKAIRDGIILREILGPPAALRDEISRGS